MFFWLILILVYKETLKNFANYFAEVTLSFCEVFCPKFCDQVVTIFIKAKIKSIKRPIPAIKITDDLIEANMLLLFISLNSSWFSIYNYSNTKRFPLKCRHESFCDLNFVQ